MDIYAKKDTFGKDKQQVEKATLYKFIMENKQNVTKYDFWKWLTFKNI